VDSVALDVKSGEWLGEIEAWVREHVTPTGPLELVHDEPWSTVLRVPVATGSVWFKACAPVQAFEARLAAALNGRWPQLTPRVLGCDERRAWLLLADAPLSRDDIERLRVFEPTFVRLCADLADRGIGPSIQHDDLHHNNLYLHDGRPQILDWGDSSVAHPFASLVVTFRFLEQVSGLSPYDGWFARLRDAYLEPWGRDLTETFDLAMRIGRFAHAIAWIRQRDHLAPSARMHFDTDYTVVLRRAVAVA
jgi:Ser/Thr protein kinase RdoA (MazF antagonist)